MTSLIETVRGHVIAQMPKEYFCHLQFVHKVAKELQAQKGGDLEIIEIAAMSHDLGREVNGDNDLHAERGAEKINNLLLSLGYDTDRAAKVARCALMHNKESGFASIEEEIVMNADCLSKVSYHEAFMLMVKKESFEDRARWVLKYLDKGFTKATFSDVKEKYREIYQQKRAVYETVLKESRPNA